MKHKLRIAVLAGACVAAGSLVAYAAGMWSTLPVVGGSSYCASNVSGVVLPSGQGPYGIVPGSTQGTGSGICGQTVPAGPPSLTGEEMIPADTQLDGGASPQTVVIPSATLGAINEKINRLNGGDFSINLWQRGTTPVSGASPATYVMSADRWFAISASNVMTISQNIPATTDADYIGNLGFNAWMRVARPSGTPSGSSCVGQILDQKAAAKLIGSNGILSFYGYAPTTFSASNSAIQVSVAYYTATDSVTAGTNTATAALSASGQTGGIAGYTAAVAGASNGTTGTLASGVETIPLSTTPMRYSIWAPIPAANTNGTRVIGVIVSFCDTPTSAATVSTDYFEIEGVQLQAMPAAVSNLLPNGVTSPTGFEFINPSREARNELAYSYVFGDGGTAGHGIFATGWAISTAAADLTLPFPVPMREAPTVSVTTPTSFAVFELNGTTTQACTTLAAVANSKLTTNQAALTCTTSGTALTADAGTQLTSDATAPTNFVTALAEP